MSFPNNPNLLSSSNPSVEEGGKTRLGVRLQQDPGGTLNLSVQWFSGDPDVYVSAGASLCFNSGNWNTNQTVTLAAAENPDTLDRTAVFRVTGSGLPVRAIFAAEVDNDLIPRVSSELDCPFGSKATLVNTHHVLCSHSRNSGSLVE